MMHSSHEFFHQIKFGKRNLLLSLLLVQYYYYTIRTCLCLTRGSYHTADSLNDFTTRGCSIETGCLHKSCQNKNTHQRMNDVCVCVCAKGWRRKEGYSKISILSPQKSFFKQFAFFFSIVSRLKSLGRKTFSCFRVSYSTIFVGRCGGLYHDALKWNDTWITCKICLQGILSGVLFDLVMLFVVFIYEVLPSSTNS